MTRPQNHKVTMENGNSSAESSTSAQRKCAQAVNGGGESSIYHQHTQSRRTQLQQQCLQPGGLEQPAPFDSRQAAWLYLLHITQDDILAHARSLQEKTTSAQEEKSSTVSSLLSESLSSPISLDKDGWQVANDVMLKGNLQENGFQSRTQSSSSVANNDEEWKVVRSKKSKRRLNADTRLSPPNLMDMSKSTQSSMTVSGSSSDVSTLTKSPSRNASTSASWNQAGSSSPRQRSRNREQQPLGDHHKYSNLSSRDIEQVAKDVERSFVGPAFKHLFPSSTSDKGDASKTTASKLFRRKQLSHLVLTTLNNHPSLNYFQGFHDILSVVLLTLAPTSDVFESKILSSPNLFADSKQQATIELVAERLSMHVLRDNFTRDLTPIMGQLKLISHLLRLSDPTLAKLVDRASPLPFFALPWLLTIFTHDAIEVGVMQRVVEFVIAFGPAAAIYLCAVVLESTKDQVVKMDVEMLEDPAMLHSILARLPLIRSDAKQDDRIEVTHEATSVEKELEGVKGDSKLLSDRVDTNAIYSDPDVELPSLASDRALASASHFSTKKVDKENKSEGVPIYKLLEQTVELMERYALNSEEMGVGEIMGCQSVLFTWSEVFDECLTNPNLDDEGEADSVSNRSRVDWRTHNAKAEAILSGPIDKIVRSPHPDSSTSSVFGDDTAQDEKKRLDHSRKRGIHPLDLNKIGTKNARMITVVGIGGLIVAALFTASQNSSGLPTKMTIQGTTEDASRVVMLVVSLLSNWGRLVGKT
ncbi:related to GYP8 - GTPase-activating protein [Melanopsichium pennsylvanicum]|uniref:Related to GYP8 - GTPase-activating protein n=2 Tax=Melanopsichium pennsylvanicum TaxID=63383 RepID=A0AAJ4XQ77_9BASI|nr:gtpase activator protein [Melanopsichium pennsylvanicum 4]SNX86780.1 related to GYP8 - GTPase-activating protein [Melanopsichium pennsylvanicum]